MKTAPPPPATLSRNLLDHTPGALEALVATTVSKRYQVDQIAEWVFDKRVTSFDAMTNLSRHLREDLARHFSIDVPETVEKTPSAEDGSYKLLFRLADSLAVEAVYIPMKSRTTICVSSQAGCSVGCTFCVTGFFGPGRNLTPAEILGQIHAIQNHASLPHERTNIVFMGMGEPLLNSDNLHRALESLYRNIAPRRITVSTSGIIPGIDALGTLDRRPNLAVSLNAPDQERRREIMPITTKYPIDDLIESLRRFPLDRGRSITLEYVLLDRWNDSPSDAKLLAASIRRLEAKVNVIPFNPDPKLPEWMKRPSDERIDAFAGALSRCGVTVTVRRSKGLEIAAACGQLKGKDGR